MHGCLFKLIIDINVKLDYSVKLDSCVKHDGLVEVEVAQAGSIILRQPATIEENTDNV
jgi:hypothetical protein